MRALSPRLSLTASFVNPCRCLCDIGTDHAYLPIWLVSHGVASRAIAADVRQGPLDNAAQNVTKAGLEDKIELRLSDGLDRIMPGEAQEIVMAGMGGILISEIMGKAEWLRDEAFHLVLQPQSHQHILRSFLTSAGFRIEREKVCRESKRFYTAMGVRFEGEPEEHPEGYEYYGELLCCKDSLSGTYLEALAARLRENGSRMRTAEPSEAEKLIRIGDIIDTLIEQ